MSPDDVPDGPLLVDADVVSYLHAQSGRHADFEPLLAGHLLVVSFAAYAEVLAKGFKAGLGSPRMGALRRTLSGYVVLPYSSAVAEVWARVAPKVQGHLHAGGANDLWSAAVAVTYQPQLPVVTNNLADFQAIRQHLPGLVLVHPDV